MLALLLAVQVSSVPATPLAVPATELDRAVQCAAYGQMLRSLVDPTIGARIRDYWQKRSMQLGKKQSLSADQVTASMLTIRLESDDAIPILLRCIDATPKSASGLQ